MRSAEARRRLEELAVPPAWTDVRFNPNAGGRIQALGLDAAGRIQYLYHARFEARRARSKFERLEHFGEHLPAVRRITTLHLQLPGLPKERVLAVIVRLMEELHFRPGGDKHTRANGTFGLTTLQNRHLRFTDDGAIVFSFPAKHHVPTRRVLVDATIARILWEVKAIRGSRLFKYVGADGRIHVVRDRDLNAYVKRITSREFTAKDFRTWAGTLHVASELARLGPAKSKTESKRKIAQAVRAAAARLGNTPAVCRSAYLHPAVVKAYERGVTMDAMVSFDGRVEAAEGGYRPAELALLELFQRARTRAWTRGAALPPTAETLAAPLPLAYTPS